ncbi:MAG: hypothetical protein JO165_09200 [Candidatus Eremiobacteraeota bacterium]|nr:hypothetical protein [Candidatus Eremiobacteraeota bacterium]
MKSLFALVLALTIAQLSPQSSPTAVPPPSPSPTPMPTAPIYAGNPAASFRVISEPTGFDPDGNARWVIKTRFLDAQRHPTRIMANSDIDWLSKDGYVQWQTRMRYGQPGAILKATHDGPLTMTVRVNKPQLGSITVHTDTRTWKFPRVVAEALGPHTVQVGWFPRESANVRITRIGSDGNRTVVGIVAGASTFRDTHVNAGRHYRYVVARTGRGVASVVADTPAEPPPTNVSMASGKAMWLFFSDNPIDSNYYGKWDPQAIVDTAVRAGLHYVELRTAYGAFFEVNPDAKAKVDAVIDGLAAHGIGTMAWSVPRDTTYEDLKASVDSAYYTTAKGTKMTGLAIDVERGDEFMGGDPQGLTALWKYMQYLRGAMGPKYLLVATVEDPYFEHLDNVKYPFEQVAQYSDVLQPMSYWRMMNKNPTTAEQVRQMLPDETKRLLELSKRDLPVSIGGQTTAEGRNGNPPADEITASLDAAKASGAIGECFFDWDGTQPYQWDAIAAYNW